MKKAVILMCAIAVAAAPLRSSFAGDRERTAAGTIIAALVALAIIGDLVADEPPVCMPAPPPCRVIRVHTPRHVWVEGRYVEVVRRIWVPGHFDKTWVPPAYIPPRRESAFGGRWQQRLVRPGYYMDVWQPGHFEYRRESQWIPGHWEEI